MLDTIIAPDTRRDRMIVSAGALQKIDLLKSADPRAKGDLDLALIDAVGVAIRATGLPALRNIQIEIDRGTVVLWGRVPTYHQKQLAQAVAQKVEGVRGVANGIEVVCRRWNTTDPRRRP
jgi:hypothetical protein